MKTTIEDVNENVKGSRDSEFCGDQKSKNLNEVVQRMLKVKQIALGNNSDKNQQSYNKNQNSNNMIDVQFATASKHPMAERCFGELKNNGEEQLGPILKSERVEDVDVNEITPFIPPSVLDRQNQQNGDVKSNGSASSAQSPSSNKEDDHEISHSPTDLQTTFSQDPVHNPSHPSICSLTPNQFMGMASSSIKGVMSSIGPSMLTASNVFPNYHQEILNRIGGGNEEVTEKITSPSTSSSHASNEGGGTKGRGGRGNKNTESARNGDENKPQYKRPPHTYPALIASAILDSPGNLITLRGIYDYIMSNFPYYKYCHDKSAWQNSIRHNLSLNQCFVKVPRYENAAKSNFWTMTQDGFEEFGNENSFKRRRRRGAALAPISAYKNKKYSSSSLEIDNSKNNKSKSTIATAQHNAESAWPQSVTDSNLYKRKNQILDDHKRRSPNNDIENGVAKHPRMMILKQGDGPKMYKSASEQLQRPNSLSSVEEMQGNVNSFTKSLSATESAKKKFIDQEDLAAYEARAAQQQWFIAAAAAQKNLLAGLQSNAASMAAGMFPYLVSSSPNHSPSSKMMASPPRQENGSKDDHLLSEVEAPFDRTFPVLMDGIEIGTRNIQERRLSPNGLERGTVEVQLFQCRFCDYKYHGEDDSILKHHCQILHRQEIIRLKNLATSDRVPERRSSPLQLPPFNWQPATSTAPPANISLSPSGIYSEPLLRSFAHHMTPSVDQMTSSFNAPTDAQKQQQLLALLQQAMMANAQAPSADSNRRQLLYQQMMMQNSLFQQPQNQETPDQLPLPLVKYLKYQNMQDKEQRKTEQTENNHRSAYPRLSNSSHSSDDRSVGDERTIAEESDSSNLVHGWKRCVQCDFTAKGNHGLELHCRKVHGETNGAAAFHMSVLKTNTELPDSSTTEQQELPEYKDSLIRKISRDAVSEPGYPLTAIRTSTISTQTSTLRSDDRTCKHCDVTFGDEMMYALHMSCHDKASPYTCTICGQNCQEKYYFNVHLLRGLHTPRTDGATPTDKQRNELANHNVAAIDNRE